MEGRIWIDRLVMVFAVIGFSVPVFVLAYILIFIFAIGTNLLPVQGYVSIAGASCRSCRTS